VHQWFENVVTRASLRVAFLVGHAGLDCDRFEANWDSDC
jgi:hypothetical protein